MSPLGEAALALARRGLPVFPVRAGGKQPLIPGRHRDDKPAADQCRGECGGDGHGCWDGTIDLDRVRAWWERWPSANIGVRTGELFDVLDPDGTEGIAALVTLPGWATRPDCWRAWTGAGAAATW